MIDNDCVKGLFLWLIMMANLQNKLSLLFLYYGIVNGDLKMITVISIDTTRDRIIQKVELPGIITL